VCDANRAAVRGLSAETKGRVQVRTIEHLLPEAVRAREHFGWGSHGMVLTRGGTVVWSASDHRATAFEAMVATKRALGEPGDDCR
jgi:hypothetical protein